MRTLTMIVLAAACAAPGCKAIADKNEKADTVAESVLSMTAANQADKMYDEMGATELRDQVARDKWQEVIKLGSLLGAAKSFKRTSFDIKTNNGVVTGEYGYDVTWEKGAGAFTLRTKWEGDGWKVLGVKFPDDAIEKVQH